MKLKILLATITLILYGYGYACTCNGAGTLKDSYGSATTVVHGTVMGIKVVSFAKTVREDKEEEIRNMLKRDKRKLELFESGFVFEITLKVIDKFKGNIGDTVTIFTTINGASCGYRFEIEKEYIVYASSKSYSYGFFLTEPQRKENVEKPNTFWTSHCTRTTEYYPKEADELRKLRK